jgi:hypothetical protein
LKEYNLRLNQEEIDVLASVLSRIGGDPEKSPRRVTEGILSCVEPHCRKDEHEDPRYTNLVSNPMWFYPYPHENTPKLEELPNGGN